MFARFFLPLCPTAKYESLNFKIIMRKTIFLFSLFFALMGCQAKNEAGQPHQSDDNAQSSTTQQVADTLITQEEEVMDISQLPPTAKRTDAYFQYAVYVNEEPDVEGYEDVSVYSVWLADERTGTVRKICHTNPASPIRWEQMRGAQADAVDVPLTEIASAEMAWIAPGDVSKVIVQGCPDARNEWTYIIDTKTLTAKQFPSTEGVISLDWEKHEVILASYGYYPEGGRYSFNRAYSIDGKYLRDDGEKYEN